MSNHIKLILVFIGFVAVGVWYFLAGMYGWKYPRLKYELGDSYKTMTTQFFKILLGAALVVLGIWGLIEEIFLGGAF